MIENLKKRFPVFSKNPDLVFFDTAASALKVDSMIKAVTDCYSFEYANIHRGIYELSSKLTKRYEDARLSVSKFINSPSAENIIFTKIHFLYDIYFVPNIFIKVKITIIINRLKFI